jgi:F-type H+-transporting ATPase subunit b
MINTIVVAAEDAAPNPLLPATYDIVWSAVVFVILLIAFWRVFLPKMQAMLDERAEAIEGNIAKADEAQAKAEAALQEYTAQLASARLQVLMWIGIAFTEALAFVGIGTAFMFGY